MTRVRTGRRILFQGLGALGVAAALAGCGGEGGDGAQGGGGDGGDGVPEGLSGRELARTDEVPVGGGVVLTDIGIVVTQPTEGEFKAFTTTCTHQSTEIDEVEGETMVCPAHGSRFSIADGAVEQGPATEPLPDFPVRVEDGAILVVG